MSIPPLSTGSIRGMNAEQWSEDNPPLLQVLDIKQMAQQGPNGKGGQPRFRLVLSDGETYQQAMVASQSANMVSRGDVKVFCIIKLTSWILNPVNNKKVIIALKMQVAHPDVGSCVGTPVPVATFTEQHQQPGNPGLYQQPSHHQPQQPQQPVQPSYQQPHQSFPQQPQHFQQQQQPSFNYQQQPQQQQHQQQQQFHQQHQYQQYQGNAGRHDYNQQGNGSGAQYGQQQSFHNRQAGMNGQGSNEFKSGFHGGGGGGAQHANFYPIASLNPYQNRWTIKARVTKKGDMRTWQNDRGSGNLFSVDLLDKDGGEIRATMFKDVADKLYNVFHEGKVYTISKGSLKLANKRWNTLNNEYELTLNNDAEVQEVAEATEIKLQKFDFCQLVDMPNREPDTTVDVIGIVQDVQPLSTIISKRTSKEVTKRTFSLIDATQKSIEITLWGQTAEAWTEDRFRQISVLAIKGCKVSDFGGRSLSASFGSTLVPDADIPEAHQLLGWYQKEGKSAIFEALSTRGGGGSGNDPRRKLCEIKEQGLGYAEKADYFTIRGMITFVRHDFEKPPWYDACTKEGCNKKVQPDDTGGGYFCEKCNMQVPQASPRYILSFMVVDETGSSWLTAFNDVATDLLGHSAPELKTLVERNNQAEWEQYFVRANFKSYIFKVKAKMEKHQDEERVKCTAVAAVPLDFASENILLLKEIEELESRPDAVSG